MRDKKIDKLRKTLKRKVKKYGKKKAVKRFEDDFDELRWLIAKRDGVCIGWDPDGD